MTFFQNVLMFAGRVCFAIIFLLSGVDKIFQFDFILNQMQAAHYPMAKVLLILMLVLELAAGLLIFMGWKTRFGVLLALVSVILIQFVFHGFLQFTPSSTPVAQSFFWINLALFGGGLVLMAAGPGQISLDGLNDR